MHNPIHSTTMPSALELSKIEIHAKSGHMGPYSAQFAGLIALIRHQEATLAASQPAQPSVTVDTPELPVPAAFMKSGEWEDALKKRQSFNGWRIKYSDCDMALYTAEQVLAHTAAAIAAEQTAKQHVIQQAQQWAMEARTHRGTVIDILRHFGCPEEDWHALELIKAAAPQPAQSALSDAVEAMNRAKALRIWDNDVPHALHVELDIIFKALAASQQPVAAHCQHRIVDARNPIVKSGYLCIDCGALFHAADHETKPAAAPVQAALTFDEVWDAIDWDNWRMTSIRELVRHIHSLTTPQTADAAPVASELDFLEEWMMLASTPLGLECCGQSGGECCGNAVAVERKAEDVISAMAARHRELMAAPSEQVKL